MGAEGGGESAKSRFFVKGTRLARQVQLPAKGAPRGL